METLFRQAVILFHWSNNDLCVENLENELRNAFHNIFNLRAEYYLIDAFPATSNSTANLQDADVGAGYESELYSPMKHMHRAEK